MSLLTRDREADVEVDPRIAARRQDVEHERRRRRHHRFVAAAITFTLVGGAVALSRSPAFDIDSISVHAGDHTSEKAIRDALGVRVGDHLVDVDTETIAARVRALPWVKDAVVERFWIGRVGVTITERAPVAALHTGADQWFVVDADGRVLEARAAVAAAAPDGLPVIEGVPTPSVGDVVGPDALGAITAATSLTPGLRTRVVAVRVGRDGELSLDLRPVGVARLGTADDLPKKLATLQTVFAQVDLAGLCVVDVRGGDAAVLTRGTTCA